MKNQITVREMCELLKDVKELRVSCEGATQRIDTDYQLDMAAYGDFVVGGIYTTGEGEYELKIATTLIRRGGAGE